MNRKKEIQDELREISPFLSSLDKKEGYQVPKDYFQNLSDQIMDKVTPPSPAPEPRKSWLDEVWTSIQFLFQPRYAVGFAGIAALLVAGIFFLRQPAEVSNLADSSNTIESYISDNIDDFDAELLWELESTADNESIEVQESGEEMYLEEILDIINDEDLEEFL